jgi:hypothetical protein
LARQSLIVLVAAGIAAGGLALALPPSTEHLAMVDSPRLETIAGAFHVHTDRSDGSASMDEIAAAARDAGLQFVVFTDHGDGTRPAEPPAYRHGVLTIDGVEISTTGGHYVAIGMSQAPYPLAGEPRDVVEDVARLGGFGVIAHGDSPRPELQWSDWSAAVGGLEWLSLDSAWRRASFPRLAQAFLTYWFKAPETLGALLTSSPAMWERFDALAQAKRTVSLAATDAHGRWLPSYAACFRTMTTRVELERPPTGDAARDAASLIAALAAGRHHTVVDAIATPSDFEFIGYSESQDRAHARQGGTLPTGSRVIFEVRVSAPAGAEIVLHQDGEVVRRARAQTMIYQADGSRAAYRVEVHTPDSAVPWMVSNPIYVGEPAAPPDVARPAAAGEDAVNGSGRIWTADRDATSASTIEAHDGHPGAVVFRYALGAGAPRHQSASISMPVPGDLSRYDRITFDGSASRPLRMVVQFVRNDGGRWSRWQRSVYLDSTPRTVSIFFDDLRPAAPEAEPVPLSSIHALVFQIDTNNTPPGTDGEIIFNRIAYQR